MSFEALRVFYCTANMVKRGIMMTTKLANYIKQERIKQKLNYAEVSRKMGYKNLNKGMRRIIDLEREGKFHPEVLDRIIDALNLDKEYIDQLIEEDFEQQKREFEEWVNEPVNMTYTIRIMPTIYLTYDLPTNINTEDEAVAFCCAQAKEKRKLIWLSPSRKVTIFISKDGEVTGRKETTIDEIDLPYMRIK